MMLGTKNKGFTLIEVLVVLAIVAITLAIISPSAPDIRPRFFDGWRLSCGNHWLMLLRMIAVVIERIQVDYYDLAKASHRPCYRQDERVGQLNAYQTGQCQLRWCVCHESGWRVDAMRQSLAKL